MFIISYPMLLFSYEKSHHEYTFNNIVSFYNNILFADKILYFGKIRFDFNWIIQLLWTNSGIVAY